VVLDWFLEFLVLDVAMVSFSFGFGFGVGIDFGLGWVYYLNIGFGSRLGMIQVVYYMNIGVYSRT
jgi:hypothetical protein